MIPTDRNDRSLGWQIAGFGLVSATGLALDCGLFLILTQWSHLAVAWANAISASAAVTFVFFASVRRVFADRGRFLIARFLAYVIYQALAIGATSWAVGTLARCGLWPIAAKLLVLPVTFGCNFVAMRILTIRSRTPT